MNNSIVENLLELVNGEICGNLVLFQKIYGEIAVEKLGLENFADFSFWDNGQTVLIYDGRQVIFDCNYEEYARRKSLTSCYSSNGLFANFSI